MKPKKKNFISRPMQLVILLGCLAGVGLWLFGRHIESMDDSPNGGIPLSWGFKMTNRKVANFFSLDQSKVRAGQQDMAPPQLDLQVPEKTETALFALG